MRFHKFRDAVLKKIGMKKRLQTVCLWFVISFMIETRRHSLTFASELSGIDKSAFSKFLLNNKDTDNSEKVLKLCHCNYYKKQPVKMLNPESVIVPVSGTSGGDT